MPDSLSALSMAMMVSIETKNAKSKKAMEPTIDALSEQCNPIREKDCHGSAFYAKCFKPHYGSPTTPSKVNSLGTIESDPKANVMTVQL